MPRFELLVWNRRLDWAMRRVAFDLRLIGSRDYDEERDTRVATGMKIGQWQ